MKLYSNALEDCCIDGFDIDDSDDDSEGLLTKLDSYVMSASQLQLDSTSASDILISQVKVMIRLSLFVCIHYDQHVS